MPTEYSQQERFDTRCIVHIGMWFPVEKKAEKCRGEMLTMPGFWMHNLSGNLTGYICQHHADYFLEFSQSSRTCHLREQIVKARAALESR